MTILLFLYFVFFLGLTIKNLKWAIYLVIFGLPSYLIRFEVGGLPMTVLEGMILILFMIWVFGIFKNLKTIQLKQIVLNYKLQIINYKYLFIIIFLFLISATVAMLVAPELQVAAGIWKAYFIEPILFLIVFITTLKKKDIKYVLMFICFNVFILSVVALYQKVTGNLIPNEWWTAETTRRVTSVFEYPNALALYLAPVVVMLIGYLFFKIQKYKIQDTKKLQITNYELQMNYKKMFVVCYLFFVPCFALVMVYFTKSKGALLGIVAGVIFYAIFYKGVRKYFVGILLIIILLGGYAIQTGKINLKGSATVEGGDSISVRLDMWGETWQMLQDKPILGAGLMSYQKVIEPYHQKEYIEIYLYPHNIFLNFWSELGLMGLISFLSMIVWFYVVGFKKKLSAISYQLSIILMSGMTTLLVHGLVDVPYFKNDLSVFFWVLIGLMIILDSYKIGENKENKV